MSRYSPSGVAVSLALLICFSRSTDLCHFHQFENGMKRFEVDQFWLAQSVMWSFPGSGRQRAEGSKTFLHGPKPETFQPDAAS
jgi:hypothetical protein